MLDKIKTEWFKLTHIQIHFTQDSPQNMPWSDLKTLDMQVQEAKRMVPSKLDR